MAASNARTVLGSALLILLAACADRHVKAKDAHHLPYAVFVSGAGKSTNAVQGIEVVRIDVGSSVKYVQTMVTTSSDGTETTATINGHPFEVGDRVAIDADGVRINGTLAGPLP